MHHMLQTMSASPSIPNDLINKPRVQLMAEKKLKDRLRKMSAAYHHHYHNAIIGHDDPDVRYNS